MTNPRPDLEGLKVLLPESADERRANLEKLFQHAERKETGCIEWTRPRGGSGRGYGRVKYAGKAIPAHRLALQLHLGVSLERWQYACHHCDNPPCINPDHLFVGTAKDNYHDMLRKGRGKPSEDTKRKRTATLRRRMTAGIIDVARGTKIGISKLTDDIVAEARRRHALGQSGNSLAREYGVYDRTMWLALHGHTWKHVPMPARATLSQGTSHE